MTKCPQCGFSEIQTNKKFTHSMAEYVYENGKSAGIFNSEEPKLTIQPKGQPQSVVTRKDLYDKVQEEKAFNDAQLKAKEANLEAERAKADALKAQEATKTANRTVVVPVVATPTSATNVVAKPLLTS